MGASPAAAPRRMLAPGSMSATATTDGPRGALPAARYEVYLAHLLEGRRAACLDAALALLAEGMPLDRIYVELFQEALYEIGRRWAERRVSVATEHLATAITEELMAVLFPRALSVERCGLTAVVSCASDEFHHLGARMVADVLEMRGWDTRFLGPSMPVETLVSLVETTRPDLIALSISIPSHLLHASRAIRKLRTSGVATPIVLGGQAFLSDDPPSLLTLEDVHVLGSLAALERFLERFHG